MALNRAGADRRWVLTAYDTTKRAEDEARRAAAFARAATSGGADTIPPPPGTQTIGSEGAPAQAPQRRQTPAQQGRQAQGEAVAAIREAADRNRALGDAADAFVARRNPPRAEAAGLRRAFVRGATDAADNALLERLDSAPGNPGGAGGSDFANPNGLEARVAASQREREARRRDAEITRRALGGDPPNAGVARRAMDAYAEGAAWARQNPGATEPFSVTTRTARGRETTYTFRDSGNARATADRLERMPGATFYTNPVADPEALRRFLLMPAARALRSLRAALLTSTPARTVREQMFNWHAQQERDAATKAILALDRTGVFGNFSPLVNMITAAKYERDPSSILTGPYLAHFATNLGRIALGAIPQPLGPNSPATNNAENAAVRAFHAGVLAPAVSAAAAMAPGGPPLQALYGIGAMFGTARGTGQEIADAVAGERTVRGRQQGQPGGGISASSGIGASGGIAAR